jgi:hypothetical protein
VTKSILPFSVCHIEKIVNAQKETIQLALAIPTAIMIAYDKVLFSFQLPKVLFWRLFAFVDQIPENIYGIPVGHFTVPVADKSLIHFFNAIKWTIAKLDYIFMA